MGIPRPGTRVLLLAVSLLLLPKAAPAQESGALIARCSGVSQVLDLWCVETTVAVQAVQGALGLAASGGTDLPGSASTLGWRMKGSPRIGIGLKGNFVRADLPSLQPATSSLSRDISATIAAIHATATVGLFDGFSLGPTLGGFGSVDLTLTGQWVATPEDAGLRDNLLGWGFGGRLGILRESFSTPGLSLSAVRRSLGESSLFMGSGLEQPEADFHLNVTSIRGLVGKDIGGIGFLAGTGWDRYSGDVTLWPDAVFGGGSGDPTLGSLTSDRLLYFLGASMTFIALQISGEVGLAEGFDAVPLYPGQGGYDPTTRSVFGGLSLRITF